MDDTEKYFNFIRNYNKKLQDKNTDWLDPEAMGEVIIQTARQNMQQERKENAKKHYKTRR